MSPDRARPRLQSTGAGRYARRLVARRRRLVAAVMAGVAAAGFSSPVMASSGGGRRITDAENTRTVYLVGTVLIVLAIGLAVFTWWFWRSTRRDHEALAPLEVMGDRKFLASDTLARQVMLDGNRPVGAAPLAPGAPEPLLVTADTETDANADVAPATLVLAPVGEGEGTHPTADTAPVAEGDAGAGVETVPIDAPAAIGDAPAVADEDVPVLGANDVVAEPGAEPDQASTAMTAQAPRDGDAVVAGAAPGDGDPTMAIEVTTTAAAQPTTDGPATTEPAAESPAAESPAAEPVAETGPVARVDAASVAAAPIDPGLPVPPATDEPVQQLSLAELVALHPEAPLGFDDDELASTPSTGIPVIESAEAWVERQLVGAAPSGPDDRGAAGDDRSSPHDDPDEPTPAAVQGAE